MFPFGSDKGWFSTKRTLGQVNKFWSTFYIPQKLNWRESDESVQTQDTHGLVYCLVNVFGFQLFNSFNIYIVSVWKQEGC